MSAQTEHTRVLVVGGGPDHERDVSIESATAVAEALRSTGAHDVRFEVIDRPAEPELRAMIEAGACDVVFPVLHGPWGEGGGIQRLLESIGVPFVGSGSRASMSAMDKVRTKQLAAALGVPVLETALLDPAVHEHPPFDLPVVVKPVCQGSSIGLHVCKNADAWQRALRSVGTMPMMVEPMVEGARELAVGLVSKGGAGWEYVPIVEISPSEEAGRIYDYEAKYVRNDTVYTLDPTLPTEVAESVVMWTQMMADALGVRHLCRADYLLDRAGRVWFLELNTMPGFTSHSLLPRACAGAGISMQALCAGLVGCARSGSRAGAIV